MYNYSGLWIRLMYLCVLCFLGGVVLFLVRNRLTHKEKIIVLLLIIGLFIVVLIDCLPSIIKPKINSIAGTYTGYARITGLSPFQYEYCFEKEGKKYYIDMDAFSKRKIYPNELIVGETYTVHYEETQNLIISIQTTGDDSVS